MIQTHNFRVLIAEDDFLVCEEIIRSVKKIGYLHIGSAVNGLQAIEMAQILKPDIILMDIQMPQMDGLTATKKIQETQPTPIIILTAHDSIEMIQKAGENGVGGFLTKPPKPEEIERAVIIAMERHKDMMEMQRLNRELQNELVIRKQAEDKLTLLLKEKELLIKEVHHRVKNNFMIISSLLNLQANQTGDQNTQEILQESCNRINSMALIHEKLYQSQDLTKIDFKNYITNLVSGLYQSYNINSSKISIVTHIEKINLDINKAIPVGLVINELITNSLKHAFPEQTDKGTIEINMKKQDKRLTLTIQDNGIGLPADFDLDKAQTLGMRLVSILIRNQLDGEFRFESNDGARFIITLPE